MIWTREFINRNYGTEVYRHKDLPLYVTNQFNFFRCLEFKDTYYNRTASVLFNGNLRECKGRYSSIFPNQKLSYWANSSKTAMAEIKKHGAENNIITFWAYDDGTSTFPTLSDQEPLIIVDARKHGLQPLFNKLDNNKSITEEEKIIVDEIMQYKPDCVAYDSQAYKDGENYLFFEKGFKKLALREVRLRFSRTEGGNHEKIICALNSDYSPVLEAYGKFFAPKCRVKMDQTYLRSEEYAQRKCIYEESLQKWETIQSH